MTSSARPYTLRQLELHAASGPSRWGGAGDAEMMGHEQQQWSAKEGSRDFRSANGREYVHCTAGAEGDCGAAKQMKDP